MSVFILFTQGRFNCKRCYILGVAYFSQIFVRPDQISQIPPVPHKEDASTGGRETGKCVESMIGAVDANRTGEDVDLSIGPPQSQDSHGAGSSELPLSPEDIRSFEENGFVMLKRAFDPDVAAACRQGRKMSTKTMFATQINLSVVLPKRAECYGVVNVRSNRRGALVARGNSRFYVGARVHTRHCPKSPFHQNIRSL